MIKQCVECGAEVKSVVLHQYERRGKATGLVIFEDVPAVECPNCGEQYFAAEVSELMDKVLQGGVKPTGSTPVATFSLRSPSA